MQNDLIAQMRNYAEEYNVPIMVDEGINFVRNYIARNDVKSILEIGTAIGYSAILMAMVRPDIQITTIERDEKRYLEAIKNIKKANMQDRIHLIYKDALEVELEEQYDLLFIDAAKAQNIKFFERFEKNLRPFGTVITDNMSFHGLVNQDEEQIESRNVRQLVRKVKDYKAFLEQNQAFRTEFLEIGDGIAVSIKK
ncbi:MAG: O-methyltransferase [Bacilli bacterium]|nr:O-methyltransferase [Bacilli bacterium]